MDLSSDWTYDIKQGENRNPALRDSADLQCTGIWYLSKTDNVKGSLTITYKTYASPHTISYVFTEYADTLGAHPNTFYKTFAFDTSTGARLGLKDLFAPGTDYLGQLSKIARAKLPAIIAAREEVDVSAIDMQMLTDGTAPTEDNFSAFYLDGADLVVIFQNYQIGPYVLGSTEFHVPIGQLSGFIK
jgi:hypothetical protein